MSAIQPRLLPSQSLSYFHQTRSTCLLFVYAHIRARISGFPKQQARFFRGNEDRTSDRATKDHGSDISCIEPDKIHFKPWKYFLSAHFFALVLPGYYHMWTTHTGILILNQLHANCASRVVHAQTAEAFVYGTAQDWAGSPVV